MQTISELWAVRLERAARRNRNARAAVVFLSVLIPYLYWSATS